MKKSTFTNYKLLIIVGLFCWIKNVMSTVSNEEKIKPKKTPVELVHGKSVKLTKMPFFKGKSIFIPGELEWGENTEHLRDLEKQTDALFGKNSFLNSCIAHKPNLGSLVRRKNDVRFTK